MFLSCLNFNLWTIDWSAIAAIVSLLMVIITAISVWHNKQQLEELKRQWEDQNTPKLSCALEHDIDGILLVVYNISNVVADNVLVTIENRSNLGGALFDLTKNILLSTKFVIPPGQYKVIPLYISAYVDAQYDGYIAVTLNNGKVGFGTFNLYLKEVNVIKRKTLLTDISKNIADLNNTIKNKKYFQ